MSARVITLAAEKGGVGKTTLTTSIAAILASFSKRVLVVDTDKQANLSQHYLGFHAVDNLHHLNSVGGILDPEFDPEPSLLIHPTKLDGVFLTPTNRQLLKQLVLPEQFWRDELVFALRDFVDEITEAFDFILIDTHPDLDTLPTWAALLAAHFVLVPLQPEKYSAESAQIAEQRLQDAKNKNPRLKFLGYAINLINYQNRLHPDVERQIREHYGEQVCRTVIKRLTDVAAATATQRTIQEYAPRSQAAYFVKEFVVEMLERITNMENHETDDMRWDTQKQNAFRSKSATPQLRVVNQT